MVAPLALRRGIGTERRVGASNAAVHSCATASRIEVRCIDQRGEESYVNQEKGEARHELFASHDDVSSICCSLEMIRGNDRAPIRGTWLEE